MLVMAFILWAIFSGGSDSDDAGDSNSSVIDTNSSSSDTASGAESENPEEVAQYYLDAEAVVAAVDGSGIDWQEQAVEKAQSYIDSLDLSGQELYDQLEYEQFTPEQIEYALNQVDG